MRPAAGVLWTATMAAASGMLGLSVLRYLQARAQAEDEQSRLTAVCRAAHELTALRSSAPGWTLRGRPSAGLTPRISATLAAAGLPSAAMSSLSPEAESPIGESDLKARRTRAVLTLAGVTLPQLGAFLRAWRAREPQWAVTTLDLAPLGGAARAETAGGDLPLRVVIGLETLFVDQPELGLPPARGFVDQSGGAH